MNTGLHVGDDASSVQMNRQVTADATAVPLSDWVFADQTHEDRNKKVTKEQRGRGSLHYHEALPGTDGLYTSEPNIMLALCFADCVPLFSSSTTWPHRNSPCRMERKPSSKLVQRW
ncbi:laccase domain-containing protein [Bacillus sp. SL00103]